MCLHGKDSCLWMQKSPVLGKNNPNYRDETYLWGQNSPDYGVKKKVKKVPFMWARISIYGSKYFHLLGKKDPINGVRNSIYGNKNIFMGTKVPSWDPPSFRGGF